jgi:hypothetical protein
LRGSKTKVIRVEYVTKQYEKVIKNNHVDYVKGGSRTVETIEKITRVVPTAILSCGHKREGGSYQDIRHSKNLDCYECER